MQSKKEQRRQCRAREKVGSVRKIGNIDTCCICGKSYTVESGNQRYCPKCAKIMRSFRQAMADHKRRGSPLPTIDSITQRVANLSGVPCVSRSRSGKRWIARYKGKYLGAYDSIAEASAAIDARKMEKQS